MYNKTVDKQGDFLFMRKTKIVCTVGPACNTKEAIKSMALCGMNVARLNFSHGTHEYHKNTIDILKQTRHELRQPLAILLDTKGPEIRTGNFKNGKAEIKAGDKFTLSTVEHIGTEKSCCITFPDLPSQLKKGDTVLIDDGKIHLTVESCTATDINCVVTVGGTLGNHKGINLPGISIDMPYISETDKKDIIFGIENDVDFIAASFVRRKEDVIVLRKFIDYYGGHKIKIISKIENIEGVENFDSILQHSDGIMVARGDMGVEVDYEKLPGIQKRFIRRCYQAGKMVITATQMLESMISNPSPTRAEITDVANAVFDGTSAVMLSGETAAGKYPIEALKTMAKISEQAEKDLFEIYADSLKKIRYDIDYTDTTSAVCDAACTTARDINAKAIIAVTKSGQTARRMSKFRPDFPIVAATPSEKTFNQLSLSWGVYPVLSLYQNSYENLMQHAIDCAKQIDTVKSGDLVVIAAGIPLDTPGSTNLLKIETVQDDFK